MTITKERGTNKRVKREDTNIITRHLHHTDPTGVDQGNVISQSWFSEIKILPNLRDPVKSPDS